MRAEHAVAKLAGVSVRTLHHDDELGLLVPERSASGYRTYDDASVLRLQQILIRRELGFSLEEIRKSLDAPEFDLEAALSAQRTALQRRARETKRLLVAIDAALQSVRGGQATSAALFDGFEHAKHEREAEERWSQTAAWKESKRRTSKYTAADWKRFKTEQDAVYRMLADALHARWKPNTARVKTLAEKHRQLIDRWFYACDAQHHVRLAELYEADARFTANIDGYAPGLTAFVAAAIRANAEGR